ncbi:MAG: cytochrome P450 [Pirellulaceae bacterium]|nr:cytochrome P450 [Pirellulaceae bacterium]
MSAILRPPGPRDGFFGLRLVGQIQRDLLPFYARLHREYGDIAYMRLGPYHDYTLFHPDQFREVLVEKGRSFIRFPWPIQVLRQWNGDGLLITEGETWLRHRRIIQPAFSPKRFAPYAEQMTAAMEETLAGFAGQADPIEFEQAMNELTLAVICRTMFGTDLGDERRELRRAVQILSDTALYEMFHALDLPDWVPLPRKRRKRWAMHKLDGTVRRIIRERRAEGRDHGDLLSMLLLAVDDEGDGQGLTDEQVRDHCVTIFLAGHDTTAAGLTWLGWALASQPEIAERGAEQVAAAIGNRVPTFADLPQLGFVERIVKETLRRWPPAIALFARQPKEDVQIGGWQVPRGSVVRVMSYVTHHDERWFPDPHKFDPDRFAPCRVESIPHCAYLPFGAGPRVCIGNSFAMLEMTLFAALLLQRFRLAPAPGQTEPELVVGMSSRPQGGLKLLARPR